MGIQHEIVISLYDLQTILTDLVGSGNYLYVHNRNQPEMEIPCQVIDFDSRKQEVEVSVQGIESPQNFPIALIDRIEFDSHYRYRTESAKIFKVS